MSDVPTPNLSDMEIKQINAFNPKDPDEWRQVLTDRDRQRIVKFGLNNTDLKLKAITTKLPMDVKGHSFPTYKWT